MMIAAALFSDNSESSGAKGLLRVSLTVLSSTASTAANVSAACLPRVATFIQRCSEATTSVEFMSEPLWNLTPVRSGTV
jgi:hypothetical protein